MVKVFVIGLALVFLLPSVSMAFRAKEVVIFAHKGMFASGKVNLPQGEVVLDVPEDALWVRMPEAQALKLIDGRWKATVPKPGAYEVSFLVAEGGWRPLYLLFTGKEATMEVFACINSTLDISGKPKVYVSTASLFSYTYPPVRPLVKSMAAMEYARATPPEKAPEEALAWKVIPLRNMDIPKGKTVAPIGSYKTEVSEKLTFKVPRSKVKASPDLVLSFEAPCQMPRGDLCIFVKGFPAAFVKDVSAAEGQTIEIPAGKALDAYVSVLPGKFTYTKAEDTFSLEIEVSSETEREWRLEIPVYGSVEFRVEGAQGRLEGKDLVIEFSAKEKKISVFIRIRKR